MPLPPPPPPDHRCALGAGGQDEGGLRDVHDHLQGEAGHGSCHTCCACSFCGSFLCSPQSIQPTIALLAAVEGNICCLDYAVPQTGGPQPPAVPAASSASTTHSKWMQRLPLPQADSEHTGSRQAAHAGGESAAAATPALSQKHGVHTQQQGGHTHGRRSHRGSCARLACLRVENWRQRSHHDVHAVHDVVHKPAGQLH